MLARRQELNTQLQVVIDGFLLAISLWVAWLLRCYGTFWFGLRDTVDPFHNYHWLFIVIMPFGPILLDLQGFYQSPLNKTVWRSIVQIVRAMVGLSIIVGGWYWLSQQLPTPLRRLSVTAARRLWQALRGTTQQNRRR